MSLIGADVQHLVIQALRDPVDVHHRCPLFDADSRRINGIACCGHDSIELHDHTLAPWCSAQNEVDAGHLFAEACGTARTELIEGEGYMQAHLQL